jgi:hypothetical protein
MAVKVPLTETFTFVPHIHHERPIRLSTDLLMDLGDAGTRTKFVLHDRDASFTQAFDAAWWRHPRVSPGGIGFRHLQRQPMACRASWTADSIAAPARPRSAPAMNVSLLSLAWRA